MPIGRHTPPRENLNERHERQAFISRLKKHLEAKTQVTIIKELTELEMGLHDPYMFYMERNKNGIYVPEGSDEGSKSLGF